MVLFHFADLSKQAQIGYNALYNVVLNHALIAHKDETECFTVPLCLNADNKVALTEKNFIFFDSVLSELKVNGYYNIVSHNGRAVEETKTDFSTVEIFLTVRKDFSIPSDIKNFDFSEVDTTKLMKRNGNKEKAKTLANKMAKDAEKAKTEETSKELEEKKAEVETLKKEVAKKEEQLNKKAIAEFNDDALLSIADCIETLIKKHCKMVPANFDFSAFESDLFKAIENKWEIK
jgi:hypothetical protein